MINMRFCQNPVACQLAQQHVQSSQWILIISPVKHAIWHSMISSTCSIQGLSYKLCTYEFGWAENGWTACWLFFICWKFRKMLMVNIPRVPVCWAEIGVPVKHECFWFNMRFTWFKPAWIFMHTQTHTHTHTHTHIVKKKDAQIEVMPTS